MRYVGDGDCKTFKGRKHMVKRLSYRINQWWIFTYSDDEAYPLRDKRKNASTARSWGDWCGEKDLNRTEKGMRWRNMNFFSTRTKNLTDLILLINQSLITLSIFKRAFKEVISFKIGCTTYRVKVFFLIFSKYVAPNVLKLFDEFHLNRKL